MMTGRVRQTVLTTNRAVASVLILAMVGVIAMVGCSISPKDRLNPLDSDNDETGYDPFEVSLSQDIILDGIDTTRIHHIEWRDIPHEVIVKYHLFRKQANLYYLPYVFLDEFDVGDTCYDDSTFNSQIKYFYRVTAIFSGGEDSIRSSEYEASRWYY